MNELLWILSRRTRLNAGYVAFACAAICFERTFEVGLSSTAL